MDIPSLLARHEDKTLEFKRELPSSPDRFLHTVVAFANTAGGVVVIGVEDRTRDVLGVPDVTKLEERVVSLIYDNILPRVIPNTSIHSCHNAELLAVEIPKSSALPHHIKEEGPQEGVYVRVGSTNRKADSGLIEEMKRYYQNKPYDSLPMPQLRTEDIDFEMAAEQFAGIRELEQTDLESLQLVTRYQDHAVPTNAGILLFGRDRLKHFPNAWIKAGFFAGTDKARILDIVDIKEPLVDAVEAAVAFVEKHTVTGIEIGRVRRTTLRSLPAEVVREAIINAVVHADYSQQGAPIHIELYQDRLVVENPGILPFGMTVEDLRDGTSRRRNLVVSKVFNELGLVEEFGTGAQRMIAACRAAGIPQPVWEETTALRLHLTLGFKRVNGYEVGEADESLLLALRNSHGMSTGELVDKLGMARQTVARRLKRLVDLGLVKSVGTSTNDPTRKYFAVDLEEHGAEADSNPDAEA